MTTLRPYQQRAVDAAWKASGGIVVAPTGSGKTEVALGLCRKVLGPVVVLVHTRELVDQWVARARKAGLTAEEYDGTGSLHARVNVATVQGLALRSRLAHPSAVIVDEVHHAAATTWRRAIRKLNATKVWGFTATLEREDGKVGLVKRLIGPVVAEVSSREVEAVGAVLRPMVQAVRTGWRPWTGDAADDRTRSPARNALILQQVERAVAGGRRVVVIVGRVEHAQRLAQRARGRGIEAAAMVGALTATERRETLSKARGGTLRALFATSLVDEGLDVPGLDTLVLAEPTQVCARTRQRIGRILRPAAKRTPLVIDLIDADARSLTSATRRRTVYVQAGWALEDVKRPGSR